MIKRKRSSPSLLIALALFGAVTAGCMVGEPTEEEEIGAFYAGLPDTDCTNVKEWALGTIYGKDTKVTDTGDVFAARYSHTAFAPNWNPKNAGSIWLAVGHCRGAVGGGQPPPPPPAPPPPPVIGVTAETIDVAGTPRSFVLAAPSPASSVKALVLVLHGDGGDGAAMRGAFPLDDASGSAAVVAYPSGTDRSWDLYSPAADNRDLPFLEALVDSLTTRFGIEPGHVFASGFSSGAFMVSQLACRRPTLLRAIAPHSGGAPSEPN
ncbi:MAG TPA: hypothetical protein VM261_14185, partial [Kofleriaceae bacterium]|nr:hypothetical protein [Kofleriaceae bacterium]